MTTDQSDPWLNKSVWDVSAAVALLLGLSPEVDGHGFVYIDTPPYRPIAPIVGDDRVEVCSKCSTEHKYAPECPKCGYVYPHRIDWHQRMKEIRALAYEDIDAGKLPYLLKRKDRRVAPRDFCQWAIWRGYEIPVAWRGALLDEPAPMVQQDQVATSITANPSPVTKPKRRVTWQTEMLKEWSRIVEAHGSQPDVVNVMRWLKKHGPVEVFPRTKNDPYSLVWMDQYGNIHQVQKKTVSNVISKLRTSGDIPD